MKPAVIYAAKSTEDKKDSIPDQIAGARRLATERGWQVAAEYHDEAKSAYHGNRGDGLAAAMRHAERIAPCALIVEHSSRLARGDGKKARHLAEIVLWAIKYDVQIVSIDDPGVFMDGSLGVVMGAIGGYQNTEDSKRKGEAVKRGQRRRVVERGKFNGGRRPFGYRYEWRLDGNGNKDSRLTIDPAEAAVVHRIFSEYLRGVAQNRIARDLKEDGVPTLTPEGSWYATTVAGMLRNPLYIGRVVLNGEDYPGDHEPIIDDETWERARQLRAGRHANGRPRGRRTAGRHLLTEGLFRCTCGSAMSPVTKRDKHAAEGTVYETYACVKRLHHGTDACDQRPIKREAVDGAIYRYFTDVALDLDATRRTLTDQADQKLAELDALHQQAEAELTKAEARIAKITRGWQDDVIDDAEFARQRAEIESEREAARAQAEQHARQRDVVTAALADFDAEAAMLNELATLRQLVAGEIQTARGEGLEPFRAALRRMFAGFALIPLDGRTHWGPDLDGQVWQGTSGLTVDRGGAMYALRPYVRSEAMKPLNDADPSEWPALQRVALALSANLCSLLAAW